MCQQISMDVFRAKVKTWRGRYAVNELSLLPHFDRLGWFENKKVSYKGEKVFLQCCCEPECETSNWGVSSK